MLRRTLLAVVALASLVWAAPPAADPAKAGMDAAELQRIAPRLKVLADEQVMAGAVSLVVRKGALAHFESVGWQDIEARKAMPKDAIFQIMSMTKPFTGVAIMMLMEEGRLRLNDPVERHLPEFRGQWLLVSEGGGTRVLTKPARPITIRDLMSHTSGMGAAAPGIGDIMVKMDRTLADACLIYSQQPLEFEPGSKWQYSNVGIAILGRIIEVASGMPFEKFLETRIFEPLGMVDSHIFLPASKQSRLAPVYKLDNGKLVRAGADILAGDPLAFRKGAKYPGPEHAMYSTAWDLAQFYQMMLNKGTHSGRRLLSATSVDIMTRLHTADLKAGHNPGTGFGLTWEVTRNNQGMLTGQSIGTFGHGGAFGTYGWIDPAKEVVGVFMIQLSGNGTPARDAFVGMANAAVER